MTQGDGSTSPAAKKRVIILSCLAVALLCLGGIVVAAYGVIRLTKIYAEQRNAFRQEAVRRNAKRAAERDVPAPDGANAAPQSTPVESIDAVPWKAQLAKFRDHRPFFCEYVFTINNRDRAKLTYTGEYWESETGKLRQDFKLQDAVELIAKGPAPKSGFALNDGEFFWVVVNWSNGKADVEKHPARKPFTWNKPFPLLDRKGVARRFERSLTNSVSPDQLAVTFRYGGKLLLNSESVKVMSWPVKTPSGNDIDTLVLDNVSYDPEIPSELFKYDPPPDAEVKTFK